MRLPSAAVCLFVMLCAADTAVGDSLSALLEAASKGTKPSDLTVLLDAGEDVNETNKYGSDALHHLLLNPHAAALAPVLIERGADVSARLTHGGMTPLHQAVQLNVPLATVLIQAGADVDALDQFGRPPIFFCGGCLAGQGYCAAS